MTNTNTILLTESGDLEVYKGKRPVVHDYINQDGSHWKFAEECDQALYEKWLSTKKIVKMAEGERPKLSRYIFVTGMWNDKRSFPIDVSDIVTLKVICKNCGELGLCGDGCYKAETLGYFTPPPVDKEEETQEEPQHILWVEVLKMIENNKAAHLMKYFTIKRR